MIDITYKNGKESEQAETIRTCVLDSLSLLSLSCNNKTLFSSLEKIGIRSRLVSHLAECEHLGNKYTGFSSKRVLFRRDMCQERAQKNKSFFNIRGEFVAHYRLNGGTSSFRWILKHDPCFFKCLYEGVLRGLCSIRRLDIFSDHSEDLMLCVTQDVRWGCVNGFRSHLRGSGISNNKPFKDQPIGSRSTIGKPLKGFPDFRIDVLHCGEIRANSCAVVFSKPRERSLFHKEGGCGGDSRIKLTLFPRPSEPEYVELSNMLLYTLAMETGNTRIQHLRHVIFTVLLFSRIVFTRERKNKSAQSYSLNKWSPWYLKLFEKYMSYCAQLPKTGVPFSFNKTSILPLLADFRSNPTPVIAICRELVRAIKA